MTGVRIIYFKGTLHELHLPHTRQELPACEASSGKCIGSLNDTEGFRFVARQCDTQLTGHFKNVILGHVLLDTIHNVIIQAYIYSCVLSFEGVCFSLSSRLHRKPLSLEKNPPAALCRPAHVVMSSQSAF